MSATKENSGTERFEKSSLLPSEFSTKHNNTTDTRRSSSRVNRRGSSRGGRGVDWGVGGSHDWHDIFTISKGVWGEDEGR